MSVTTSVIYIVANIYYSLQCVVTLKLHKEYLYAVTCNIKLFYSRWRT